MSKLSSRTTLRKPVFAALVMLISVGLVSAGASADTGTLEGVVTDLDTGLPIEGALVIARGEHAPPPGDGGGGGGHHGVRFAFTDANGGYAIEELMAGDYSVICGKHGYHRADGEATIVEGQTTTLDFALEPIAFGSVEGTVTDAQTGDPIAGAHVRLHRSWFKGEGPGNGWGLHAVTGPDGGYLIENVPEGDYRARAAASGYFPSEAVEITVEDGQTVTVDFALDPLAFGSVEGVVTDDSTGDPIAGAKVVLRPVFSGAGRSPEGGDPEGWWLHAITGPDGRKAMTAVHVLGTRALLDAGRRAGVRRMVLCSSSVTVGFGPRDAPGHEDSPLDPDATYGRAGPLRAYYDTKAQSERLAALSTCDRV